MQTDKYKMVYCHKQAFILEILCYISLKIQTSNKAAIFDLILSLIGCAFVPTAHADAKISTPSDKQTATGLLILHQSTTR